MLSLLLFKLYIIFYLMVPQFWTNFNFSYLAAFDDKILILCTIFCLIENKDTEESTSQDRPLFLFVAYLIFFYLSCFMNWELVSPHPMSTAIKFFLILYAASRAIKTEQQLLAVCHVFISCTLFIAVNGILIYNDRSGFIPLQLSWGFRLNWLGIFDDAGTTSYLFLISLSILSSYNWKGVSRLKQMTAILVAIVIFHALAYTQTRAAILALAPTLLVYCCVRYSLKFGFLSSFVMLAIVLSLLPARMTDALTKADYSDPSAVSRLFLWKKTLLVWEKQKMLGSGPGTISNLIGRLTHSTYLQQIAEVGVFGAYFWFVFLFSNIKNYFLQAIQVKKVQSGTWLAPYLPLGLFMSLFSLLICFLFASANIELLYLVIGFNVAAIRIYGGKIKFSSLDILAPGLLLYVLVLYSLKITAEIAVP